MNQWPFFYNIDIILGITVFPNPLKACVYTVIKIIEHTDDEQK